MAFKLFAIFSLLVATAVAAGDTSGSFSYPKSCPNYTKDPRVTLAISLAAKATTSVDAFVRASAAARTAAQVAVEAASSAKTTAASLANVDIGSGKCVASEAASASQAVASASAKASAAAQAAAFAYGKATADAYAASYAVAEAVAKLCSCPSIPALRKAVLETSRAKISLSASVTAYSQTCALYAGALSESISASTSFSTATGKMCSYCGKGYKKITLELGSTNTKQTSDGSISCTAVLHDAGLC